MKQYVKALQRVARQSDSRWRLVAVVHKHRPLAVAANILGNGHPQPSKHAEARALRLAGGNARGASLTVIRIRKDGQLALAYPCASCRAALLRAGIRQVYYSGVEGELLQARLREEDASGDVSDAR